LYFITAFTISKYLKRKNVRRGVGLFLHATQCRTVTNIDRSRYIKIYLWFIKTTTWMCIVL